MVAWLQIDPLRTQQLLAVIAATSNGTLLEDLVTSLFGAIPRLVLHDRDRLSAGGNEELDLAFSNTAEPGGLTYFDRDPLVECKSLGTNVDAQAVTVRKQAPTSRPAAQCANPPRRRGRSDRCCLCN